MVKKAFGDGPCAQIQESFNFGSQWQKSQCETGLKNKNCGL